MLSSNLYFGGYLRYEWDAASVAEKEKTKSNVRDAIKETRQPPQGISLAN